MKLSAPEQSIIQRLRNGVEMELIGHTYYMIDTYEPLRRSTLKSFVYDGLLSKVGKGYQLTELGKTIDL